MYQYIRVHKSIYKYKKALPRSKPTLIEPNPINDKQSLNLP